MFYSAETRWFFKTPTEVATIENWFNGHHQFFTDQWSRSDIYLWQPGLNNHSVKIREGKVEVKILLADRGVVQLDTANSGIVNDWIKYSFELKETDKENEVLLRKFNQPDVVKENRWLRVDKERLLIKFSLDQHQNTISQIPESTWPDEGCAVELTKIKVNQQEYCTFGLEAFSKNRHEKRNLEQVLKQVIPEIHVTNLHHRLSHSYPSFLADICVQ